MKTAAEHEKYAVFDSGISRLRSNIHYIRKNGKKVAATERKDLLKKVFNQVNQYLIKEDQLPSDEIYYKFNFVNRLVRIEKLSTRLTKIVSKCFSLDPCLHYDASFKQSSDESFIFLEFRKREIKDKLDALEAFSVDFDPIVNKRFRSLAKKLDGEEFSYNAVETLEVSIFHLLVYNSTRYNKINLNINCLEGQTLGCAVQSIINILKIYALSINNQDLLSKVSQLINNLYETLEFVYKTDFILDKWNKTIEDSKSHKKLLKALPAITELEELNQNNLEKSEETLILELPEDKRETLQRYKERSLEKKFSNEMLINQLCKEVTLQIRDMQPGEFKLYPLGTSNHCILCEIRRHASDYSFSIFNSGEYIVEGGHRLGIDEKDTEYVQPLRIVNLSLDCIIYQPFLKKILTLSCNDDFEEVTTKEFYECIRFHLLFLGRGSLINDQGVFSLIPFFGVCTTASIGNFIDNYFTKEELEQIDACKLYYCLEKQEVVNGILSHLKQNKSLDQKFFKKVHTRVSENNREDKLLTIEKLSAQAEALQQAIQDSI